MVTILTLEATNFKRLNLEHPLELGKGLTLIAGPNESGKSTILDAILYALFTRTIRPSARPRDEDILQYGTNKLTLRLSFAVQDRTFLIERRVHRNKPNEAVLNERLPSGILKPIATKVNAVNDEIAKLLGGLTFEEIVSSNVVAQKELNRIVEQRRADRIGVINAFLNLESFNQALQKLANEKRDIEGTPSTPGKLPVAKQKLEGLQTELEEWNAKSKELGETRGNQTDLENKTEALRKEYLTTHELSAKLETYQQALTKKNRIESEIKNKGEAFDEISKQIDDLNTKQKELASLNSESKKYAAINELSPTIDKLSREAEDLQGKQVQLQAREKTAPITQQALLKAREEIQAHPDAIGIGQTQRMEQTARRTTIVGAILAVAGVALGIMIAPILFTLVAAGILGLSYALILNGKASTLTAQHADYLGKMQSYESQEKLYEDYADRLSTLRTQVSEARIQLSQTINRLLPRYKGIATTIQTPLEIADAIKSKFDEEKTQSTILSNNISLLQRGLQNRPELEKKQNTLLEQTQDLQKECDSLVFPELPEGLTYSDELLANTKATGQDLHDIILKNTENINNMKTIIEKLTKFVEEKKELPHQTEEQEKALRGLEKELRVINDAKTGLEKTAESLRMRVKPSVEYYMSTFLPSVTVNRYKAVSLDDDYKLSVWDSEAGEYRPREVFSGGTEDQLLLVMRLAFALALTPETKGTRPEFLFLDEPLGSSDELRRGEIMQLLKVELTQYFRQIILVSHVQGLDQTVDHIIRIDSGRITEEI